MLDFTDAGFPSTHLVAPDDLVATYFGLLSAVAAAEPDTVVIEIADGVAHVETARLLADPAVRATLSGVLFAAGDALGALSGVNLLRSWHLRVAAVTGKITSSPLAAREAAPWSTSPSSPPASSWTRPSPPPSCRWVRRPPDLALVVVEIRDHLHRPVHSPHDFAELSTISPSAVATGPIRPLASQAWI
ncbi:hypothetical protein [Jiangella muralis]|uniref:hypothetical protein n=1 Tax=Jiangella muralis TaxID=702383 RepID=UPI00069E2DFD|nr:hypothetical protein [Jiangella muralis]